MIPEAKDLSQLIDLINRTYSKPPKASALATADSAPMSGVRFQDIFFFDNGSIKIYDTPLKVLINEGHLETATDYLKKTIAIYRILTGGAKQITATYANKGSDTNDEGIKKAWLSS